MKTQWENFLQNLGEWHGSFTKISAQGDIVEDTPSILILESLDDQNKTVRLTLRRFTSSGDNSQPKVNELVREYQNFGKDTMFFEDGAFSQGSIQISPISVNGAEFSFINQNRRLRLVELFNQDGSFQTLTLIREKRAGTNALENPTLTVDALLGKWQGEAITIYSDLRTPDVYPTQMQLKVDNTGRLFQQITFGNTNQKTITSTARIEGSILHFDQGSQPVKVLLLPDGASATLPIKVELRKPVFFEAGWLIKPDLRQRLIRTYNEKGEWVSLTLVTEHRIN
ncbi:MAG: DUF3598 family protein [Okeania sp. SIO2G4]|uniref:DUF3598 family protein n=1 Tax=unclassified Okeania TaxID=2634635 RepID=UPI0013B76F53|nr:MULTISPECIES: DUF3598 family protein [unclassified Okeania]NEP44913.1 DUF3598 family protein [Okeania sp. SIO2H7]NEP74639.1 DUF3598 family protein [Okeania sp. SIO2G5]NEP95894.1 DUF3598 family protein [Okeania sp. SIO2F5]NEQ93367.1 DUF3598 family protein [Okeania sp. SIO2G4]